MINIQVNGVIEKNEDDERERIMTKLEEGWSFYIEDNGEIYLPNTLNDNNAWVAFENNVNLSYTSIYLDNLELLTDLMERGIKAHQMTILPDYQKIRMNVIIEM